MASLTSEGLVIDRQPIILQDLKDNAKIDINPNISIRDDEVLGQEYNIISLLIARQQELIEATNNSFDPYKAEGTHLDDIGTLKGVPRQPSAKSFTSTQHFTEVNGYNIPAGSILSNPLTFDRFLTTDVITLSNLTCVGVEYSIDSVLNSTLYQVNVNDTGYTYTSDVDATALEIVTGLKASIDATTPTLFTATLDTNNLVINSVDSTAIKVTFEAYLTTVSVTGVGRVDAEVAGAINAPSNSITTMVTSSSVVTTNPASYVIGRARELDEDYRLRILNTNNTSGKATVEAIQDDTSLVSGVTTSRVIENATSTVDVSGRPAHSFETIVQGGEDVDVGDAIWVAKPAGIESHGNTPVSVTDKYGNPQTVELTRPTTINLAFDIDYTKHTETAFPADGESLIIAKVVAKTNALSLGEDTIPVAYFGDIIAEVGYLENLVVRVQQITNQGDTPSGGSWQTTKLSVSDSELARTISTDITIQEV